MLDALDITEEEAQGLVELARHDLAMARSFAARAQAAARPSRPAEIGVEPRRRPLPLAQLGVNGRDGAKRLS